MNCPRCNTPNENDARFCKNCSLPLFANPALPQQPYQPVASTPLKDNGVLLLGIILLLGCFRTLYWIFLDKVIQPIFFSDHEGGIDWSASDWIYKWSEWAFDLITLTLMIVLAVKSKNKMARIILVITVIVEFISFITYKIVPLFYHPDMKFFQF